MYRKVLRPLFFSFDPESIHGLVIRGLKIGYFFRGLWSPLTRINFPQLQQTLWNLTFPNPMGLAAGFDKDGEALKCWPLLGFGFMEAGTVTPGPQEGNSRPRIFRLPDDHALINRCGFNNRGANALANQLSRQQKWLKTIRHPVGINIGKQKTTPLEKAVDDYAYCFEILWPYGHYFSINVSSPNTPDLRRLQEKDSLIHILQTLQTINSRLAEHNGNQPKPLLVKIAPDLHYDQIDDILDGLDSVRTDGIIISNTTIRRDMPLKSDPRLLQETGGLSGQPLKKLSTDLIRYVYRQTRGNLPIIGVGGIETADDAYEKFLAGASLVQLYTGFIYQGPMTAKRILQGIALRLQQDGFRHLSEAVGKENK